MTDATAKAVEKLSDQLFKFQTEDFPNSQRELGERVKGVEVELKGVNGRLKKLETSPAPVGSVIDIDSIREPRGDDSTVVEVPHKPVVTSGTSGLTIPWKVVGKALAYLGLALMVGGSYMRGCENDDGKAIALGLDVMVQTLDRLEGEIKVLSVPEGDPVTYTDDCSEEEAP